MTDVLIDTSVLVKWFHAEGESELAPARALREAHRRGVIRAFVLDLALYELGNVLLRTLRWPPGEVSDQLEDLHVLLGAPLVLDAAGLRRAAHLASEHALTFYDACWAACASELGIVLVSADRALVSAGLAQPPAQVSAALGLDVAPS